MELIIMNIHKRQSLLFILLALISATGIAPNLYTMHTESISAPIAEQLAFKTFSLWKMHTQQLQSYLQTTAQLIINNKFVAVKIHKKNSVLSWINDCISIINEELVAHPQPTTLEELAPHLHRMLMLSDLYAHALKTSFKSINLSPGELLPMEEVSQQECAILVNKIVQFNEQFSKNLSTIESSLKTAGYSKLNRVCQRVRSINKRFHLTQCAKYGFICTTIAVIYLSTLQEKQPTKIVVKLSYIDSVKNFFSMHKPLPVTPVSVSLMEKITQKAIRMSKNIMNHTIKPLIHVAKAIDIKQASTALPMGYLALDKIGFGYEECNKKYTQYKKRLSDYLLGITDTMHEQNTFENHPRLDDPIFAELTDQTQPLNDLLAFLKDPALYIRTGISIPKALLFTGASGNGKTFTIKAFCASVNNMYKQIGRKDELGFITTDITELLSWGENGLKKVIDQAKAQAPCVVFIDEIHLLRLQQESNSKLLTDFLIILDDLAKNADPEKQIIFIAATNRPDVLDGALMRPGRFDLIIQCDYPTKNQRLHTFTTLCKKAAVNPATLNLEKLTELTNGCTFSMLNTIFNTASYQAKKSVRSIADTDLYYAFCFHVRHIIPGCSLEKIERERIAAYQAGCIVASYLFDLPYYVEAATIQQYTQAPGETWSFVKADPQTMYAKQFGSCFTLAKVATQSCAQRADKNQCYYYLAGSCSEKLLTGSVTAYGQKDAQKTIDMICLQHHSYIAPVQKDPITKPTFAKEHIDAAIPIKNQYEKDLYTLLTPYKNQLIQIQELLVNKLYITKADIDPIMKTVEKIQTI